MTTKRLFLSKKDDFDTQISKSLSWILRHGAHKLQLPIDSEGFIDLVAVISSESLQGKCTLEDIQRIVKNNDKQRFTIRRNCFTNKLEIRANQGHSIQTVTSLELIPIKPDFKSDIIHGTYHRFWPKIKEIGLSRMNRVHIHFTTAIPKGKEHVISGMRNNCGIYIYIDFPKAFESGLQFFMSSNKVILSPGNDNGIIEPKYFLKIIDVKTGYPRTVKRAAFQKFLASFGKVHKCYFYRDYTTIQYATENTYKTLLQSPLRYENNFLKIKIASPSEIPKNKNENDLTKNLNNGMNIIDPLQLVNKLTECKTADEQLMYFMKELQLPYQEIKTNYSALCQHLELALNTSLFKGCRAMPFGSTVTGLAFKWSDLDVFIQIPNISNNLTNATTLAAMYVNESRKPLQRRSDLFTKIITITKAKTPIVKCIHKPTGINCDINFKNMLGVCNSSLVNFLLNSDVRLRPMMMVIKYWAKINDITGPGKISNYALVMLLIFYLQQNPKPILPNISMLQHPSFDKIIEGWNAGYNHNFYFHTINEDSIPYLLHGFYEFYSTYEFSMKVISPFTATSISKAMFHDTEKLENIFWRYKAIILKDGVNKLHVDSCMCIQDPFEHNHNLTKCVNNTTIKHLQTCCTASALICRKAIDSQSIISLLPQLFKETPLTTNLSTQTSNYEITILPGSLIEQNTACSSNLINSEEHQRKIWYERVNEILMLILKKVMKFDISLTKCEQISKAQRTGQSTDVHDDIVESFKISCTGYYVLHSGRKKISKKIDKTSPSLKHEIAISEYILEKYYKTPIIDKKPILELDIEFMARRKPTRIVLEVINRQEKLKNYFIPCAQYLQRWLPSWMEKHLQENTEDIFTPTTS